MTHASTSLSVEAIERAICLSEIAGSGRSECGIGPGVFHSARMLLGINAMPHCRTCERLVPVRGHLGVNADPDTIETGR